MHRLPALALVSLACACRGPAPDPEPVAPPADLAQLVAAYQALAGHSVTYDEATGRLLAAIPVSAVGPAELDLLRVGPVGPVDTHDPPAPAVAVLALRYAVADELAASLRPLFEPSGSNGASGVDLHVDARMNALLVSGAPGDLERVRQLVAELDVEATAAGR